MSVKSSGIAEARSFQSDIAAIRDAPEPKSIQLTVHVLAAMLLAFVLLISFTKLDRVIASSGGKINLTKPRTVFQALDASIIKSIDVRPGDRVSKGQVLATLDPTFTGADVNQLRLQVASLNAVIERDEAENQGRAPKFTESGDPDQTRYNQLQQGLYEQRAAQYAAQLNSFDEKIKQTEATIVKSENDDKRFNERVAIAAQVEEMRNRLLASGAGSLLNQLTSKDQRVELARMAENNKNSLQEARAQLSSVRADREALVQQWLTAISQDLVTSRNTRDSALAQLVKAQRHQDLVRIVALDDSIILTVAKLSVGSVLKEGDEIITAMPVGVPVFAEVQVLSRDIGFLRVGDHAVLKIDAFNFQEHGTAEGTVKWISENAFFINDETQQPVETPYYKVGISVDDLHFRGVPANFRLVPGMSLTADMKVGRRSVALYLLEGVIKGASGAMREP